MIVHLLHIVSPLPVSEAKNCFEIGVQSQCKFLFLISSLLQALETPQKVQY
jgi:hypothetical protein